MAALAGPAPQAATIEGIAGARAYYTARAPALSIADADGVPAQLLGAIECHDLAGVQRQFVTLKHLDSQVRLGKVFSSRLRAYWRYDHVAYFQHYCSVLHWAVHVASVAPEQSKAAAHAIVVWLLQVGVAIDCHSVAPPSTFSRTWCNSNR